MAEIEHALANAEPPPPPAYGAPVHDPLGLSVMSMNPRESQVDALPQSSALKWVALGVGAFVLLSVVAAGAWFALG